MATSPASAETGTATNRVARHTPRADNEAIRRWTDESVRHHARNPDLIPNRLKELEREWDVERALETNASTLSLIGLGLGLFVDRRWLALPVVVGAFLLQHGIQGWCPPLPLMRKLGLRTTEEITRERVALKALRGDFDALRDASEPDTRARRAIEGASETGA